ncbi:type III pantothenate kinase [Lusitaniella coriacea LEGE 07157]|uniref:Type III pantothenate kinase n=1 Tax=Lusitaniella coriacea LEGE 07157 TaxID=945747 RepID=A0A8J7DXL9_9CYAN|nr:type III pantothenate kinase [Lusitaniella coriacea]MBE9116418.1 type III pantothenate kinase [Lusitaniella coriacea LEGE 07157]
MSKTYVSDWLGLTIGNSRLHWGWFKGDILTETWDSPHFSHPVTDLMPYLQPQISPSLPLYFASVVPQQTTLLLSLDSIELREILLSDVSIKGLYPTIGIDRAIALWGAVQTYGLPVLVIDAGTALTFTGANHTQLRKQTESKRSPHHPKTHPVTPAIPDSQPSSPTLFGGAILPGLRLQFQSLHQKTAALPSVSLSPQLPQRWALNTPNAIESGILYTLLAGIQDFIKDWLQQFPHSKVIFTGGDATMLSSLLPPQDAEMIVDPNLIFWGARAIVEQYSIYR